MVARRRGCGGVKRIQGKKVVFDYVVLRRALVAKPGFNNIGSRDSETNEPRGRRNSV